MELTLTDSNFDEEIKKAAVPLLVDFYADWCVAPGSRLLLDNGQEIIASRVTVGQKLLGHNSGTLGSGEVTMSKVAADSGHCVKIVTETGREVETTDNHLLYTPDGWKKADQLTPGTSVAIHPYPNNDSKINIDNRELVLARLAGILFTDGTLYRQDKNRYHEISVSVGQEKDAQDFIKDVESLGFKNGHVVEMIKKQEIAGRKFTTHLFRVKFLSKELFSLLASRGIPVGAKKSQPYNIPDWVNSGPREIKREFLRGYLGGDGPKVTLRLSKRAKKKPYNTVSINDLEFHKDPELADSGGNFGKELAVLLKQFGVEVTKVYVENDRYLRQDGKCSAIIHLQFKKDFQTAFNLAMEIGYAYSKQKAVSSNYAGEFIREIFYLRKGWQSVYHQALRLASQGRGYRYIARALQIHPSQAYSWTKKHVKATVAKHGIKFDQWLRERLAGAPEGFMWEKVNKIEQVFLPHVAKITVEDTHSFISNGFLSHNCGPCKLIAPIIEEIAKELEGKLIVGKLDVDANIQTAQKYSVMSIPTLIIFKSGQPAKQMVGYQDKQTLLKSINDLL